MSLGLMASELLQLDHPGWKRSPIPFFPHYILNHALMTEPKRELGRKSGQVTTRKGLKARHGQGDPWAGCMLEKHTPSHVEDRAVRKIGGISTPCCTPGPAGDGVVPCFTAGASNTTEAIAGEVPEEGFSEYMEENGQDSVMMERVSALQGNAALRLAGSSLPE